MTEDFINGGRPFMGGRDNQLGVTAATFREWVVTRQIRPMLRGVYVDTRIADSRSLRAAALQLVRPDDAIFFGATAAYVLGLDVFPPKDRFNFSPQCVVPHHHGRCRRPAVVCHEGYLPDPDIMEVEGLLVTTPVRSAVDMLRTMWRPHALAAADAMAHAGLVTRQEIQAHIGPMKRFPGIIQARALSALIDPLAESPGESWQRLRLVDAGLPCPESQVKVYDRVDRLIARLDNGYRESRVGIEYDGREWHDDDLAEERDESKRTFLTEVLGWRLSIVRRSRVIGEDSSFEEEIGRWLGLPVRPRRW